jgi:serine protease Do
MPLLLMLLLGVVVLWYLPALVERIAYSRARGEVQALREGLPQLNLKALSKAFTLVYRKVKPSVVHIDTRRELPAAHNEFGSIVGGRGRVYEEEGEASGVIMDAEGYIITNNHVVEDANDISVSLADGRSFPATVIGVDPAIDLAVLKINAAGLSTANWGDSDNLDVGEMAWAIGNPYGLDQTVTSGIVSAKGRQGSSIYQDLIQTDVAINPGNSGGPLVDVNGDVVGINSAIFGRNYQGISFAIPSNLAKDTYEKLRKEGKVIRGYLGIQPEPLTAETIAAEQLPADRNHGAFVKTVTRGSPAQKAGIQRGDVIVEWNGQPVADNKDLTLMIAGTAVGAKVPVKLFREGEVKTLEATVAERPPQLR